MKKWTISFFLMASNGMKFIYLKKQQNTPTKVFIFIILIRFILEHAKKTARTVRKKKKSLWKTANYSTKTLLKRIKAGSMNFPLFSTRFSNISSLMEPKNNCHLSQNIFFQICAL